MGDSSPLKMLRKKLQLVGDFNPLEKYLSKWIISPSRGENRKYLKPPPRQHWDHLFWPLLNRLCSVDGLFLARKYNERLPQTKRKPDSLPILHRSTIGEWWLKKPTNRGQGAAFWPVQATSTLVVLDATEAAGLLTRSTSTPEFVG